MSGVHWCWGGQYRGVYNNGDSACGIPRETFGAGLCERTALPLKVTCPFCRDSLIKHLAESDRPYLAKVLAMKFER